MKRRCEIYADPSYRSFLRECREVVDVVKKAGIIIALTKCFPKLYVSRLRRALPYMQRFSCMIRHLIYLTSNQIPTFP